MARFLKLVIFYTIAFNSFVAGACFKDWIYEVSDYEYEIRDFLSDRDLDVPNLFYGKRCFSCCIRVWDNVVQDGTWLNGIPTSARFCLFFVLGIPIFVFSLGKTAIFYKLADAICARRLQSVLLTRSF